MFSRLSCRDVAKVFVMDSLRKALFRALSKSHLPMLRSALSLGVSLAYEPGDPMPVFHAALSGAHVDVSVLQALEQAGADPATIDAREGASALHLAIALPDARVLEWLLSEGLDVDAQTHDGETALMRAAQLPALEDSDPAMAERALRDARVLIAAGADVNVADGHGRTALHYAVEAGAAEMVSLLLLAGGDGDVADAAGDTPLHVAAAEGRDLIARDILSSGADPKAINGVGFSGLHILAEKPGVEMTPAHLRLADALIRAGADLTQADNRGYTPLVAAAAAGNIPIAAVFVAHHADVSADSSAALRLAVLYEDNDMTDLLLKAGAAADVAAGADEERPLHTAAQEGFVHGIRVLLDHGADMEARNIDGETPLLIAARRQKYSAVTLLLERGASLKAEDHYGCTVQMLAAQRGDTHLARLLQSHMADDLLLVQSR